MNVAIYKEIYKDFLNISGSVTSKKEEFQTIIEELENYQEEYSPSLSETVSGFVKPYPVPLYYLSFFRIIKQAYELYRELSKHYEYYYSIYNKIRKKDIDFRTEEETRLLNEISETLYRIDELKGKLDTAAIELLFQIHREISSTLHFQEHLKNNIETLFFQKIQEENYRRIYPVYEQFLDVYLSMLDEKQLESGLYRLIHVLMRGGNREKE